MNEITTNRQKYENYREQMSRLKKAMNEQFYLEAIFIEYAIMEDRLESILRHSGKWNPDAKRHPTITQKCTIVKQLAGEQKGVAKKYFSAGLIDSLLIWKDKRNPLIHALVKQELHTELLKELAEDGYRIVKTLCSKTTSYNRALEKAEK